MKKNGPWTIHTDPIKDQEIPMGCGDLKNETF